MAPGPQRNCSAFTALQTECLTSGTAPKHVASLSNVEKQDKCASMFWSDLHPHVMGIVTLTSISSQLPAARSLPRPSRDSGRRSRKATDVMEFQRLRVTTQRVVLCVSSIASRCCDTQYSLCAFLSNMRQNGHSGSAVLVVFYTVTDAKRRTFSLFSCLST